MDSTLSQLTDEVVRLRVISDMKDQHLAKLTEELDALKAEHTEYREKHPPTLEEIEAEQQPAHEADETRVSDVLPAGMTDLSIVHAPQPNGRRRAPWPWEAPTPP